MLALGGPTCGCDLELDGGAQPGRRRPIGGPGRRHEDFNQRPGHRRLDGQQVAGGVVQGGPTPSTIDAPIR